MVRQLAHQPCGVALQKQFVIPLPALHERATSMPPRSAQFCTGPISAARKLALETLRVSAQIGNKAHRPVRR